MNENYVINAWKYSEKATYYYIPYTLNCKIAAKAQRLIIKDTIDQDFEWD